MHSKGEEWEEEKGRDCHVGSYMWGNKELRQIFSLSVLRA